MSFSRFAVFAMLTITLCVRAGSAQTELTISSAASLKDVVVEIETVYQRSHAKITFVNNLGASGTLAAQIVQGAPVDLFISAASGPMDEVEKNGLIVAETRRNLLRNTLVLIAPLDSKLKDFQGLTDRSIHIIALGDPASVPAGHYGSQTLTALHLINTLKTKFVLCKDVRQVLTYVETGNADAGIVYATDAMTSGRVRIVTVAPESCHDPIIYPATVIRGGRNVAAASQFLEFLNSPEAHTIFTKHGFTIAAQ